MALLTSSIIAKEFMKEFKGYSKYAKVVDKQYADKFGEQSGDVSKGGTTIEVKTPQEVAVRTGRTASFVTPDEGKRAFSVDTMYGVDLKFTDVELQLSIDDFSGRFIKPAAAKLAAKVDQKIADAAYKAFPKAVGTAGTTPSSLKTFNLARGKLVNALVPESDLLYAFVNTDASAEMVEALKGLLSPNKQIADQYLNGYMGRAAGLEWIESTHVPVHTVGPLGGTPLVKGASQGITTGTAETTSLLTDGWTSAAAARLKAGDVITITGVYDVDPLTKQTRSYLKQFTVTADVSSDASGNATVIVSPAIITAGAYQNVSAVPADDAPIVVLGAANTVTAQNLVFTPKAITLATVPLILPKGTDMAERVVSDGISMRLVRDWSQSEAELTTRIDVFFGTKVMRPEWGVRVFG